MRSHITRMGDHMVAALEIVMEAKSSFKLPVLDSVSEIVICGMGGSAIGGDLVANYLRDVSPVPIDVIRSYRLPKHISTRSLVIVSSYSGNTAESLDLFEQAMTRGAQIVCVTTGGELEAKAVANNLPLVKLPGGMQPRAALAYSFVPLLVLISAVLKLKDFGDTIIGVGQHLKELAVLYSNVGNGNPAYDLAEKLTDKIAVIYSSDDLSSVNLRWRGQLQENGNHLAFGNVLPELAHNEINGWSFPIGFAKDIHLVILRSREDDHPSVLRKMDEVRALLIKRGLGITELTAIGKNKLERLFSLISLADWSSYHLALLENIDPTEIPAIDELKRS